MGKLYLSGIVEPLTVPSVVEVGTIWLFTEDGTFNVPATGTYQVEMHGGGGGGAICRVSSSIVGRAGGGGSGELHEITLSQGQSIPVTVGLGGAGATGTSGTQSATAGGQTTFGDLSVNGGGGAKCKGSATTSPTATAGTASGSLATDGSSSTSSATGTIAGGEGNSNNTAQTYGDGGSAFNLTSVNYIGNDGYPGAVIVTFMGVS